MLFRSLLTLAACATAVSASAFHMPDDPLFAQYRGMSKNEYKKYIYAKNQYQPHRRPSKPLRARTPISSPDCSALRKCSSNTQFCSNVGICKSCPPHATQSASGTDCTCEQGYEAYSSGGVTYCRCANTVPGTLGSNGDCTANPTCISGYSRSLTSSGLTQCSCTYGTADSLGRCVTCNPGYTSTSRNGVNVCVCANGPSDQTGKCISCNSGFKLINEQCQKTCSSSASCSGATPFCSPFSSTCTSSCNMDSQCSSGQVCSSGTCIASSSTRCNLPKGSLCPNGGTCTYQGYCATNTSGSSGAYQGCFQDDGHKRILGTMTAGVDYLKADVVNIGYCQDWCKTRGFAYSGVQYYNECYCGNSNSGSLAPENQCYLSCNTASAQICGGDSRMSVYKI